MRKAQHPLFLLGLALASAAGAQEPSPAIRLENLSADQVLALAGQLIDSGRYDDALVLLDRLAADRAGGTERDFLEGMVALARKEYARAEALFRTMLEGDPNLIRVRLELARTLFLMKKDEEADYHFKLAIAQHPPEPVVRNIARFREAIRARRSWRFNVNFGFAPDTNINSATDKERIEVLGLPFELDPHSKARSGVGAFAAADANVRLRRDGSHPIYVGAYGKIVRYGDSRFNDIYVGGEAGPEFRLSGGRLRATATALKRWYGGKPLVTSVGGRFNFDKVIKARWGIEASAGVRRNDYARRPDLDGWDFDMIFTANRALGPSTLGFGWAAMERSIAGDPANSSWQGRIGAGLLKEIFWGLRPQLSIEVGREVHDRPFALFGRTRKEWQTRVTASIYKRDWNVHGFAPSIRLTYNRNASTIVLYDQERWRTEFGIAKSF